VERKWTERRKIAEADNSVNLMRAADVDAIGAGD
jgi:hypothetical protein